MTLESGTRLGSYEIVGSIGSGAMGAVYRAKDLKLGREVALKVLLPGLASDADRLRRFEQEARAASALNHPNIVHIYDVGQQQDTHYIVMELVDGTNLRQLLIGAPFTNERILDLARQMAAGLAKAHEAGIVHRDLKPENVMVTSDGFVKILDFGLAKLVDAPLETHSEMRTMARGRTRHGMLIGTVEYMSPEQAAGRAVDHRSDQFSLGLILYEMATAKLAFSRETAAQTLASIIESEPQDMGELNSDCPRELTRVVRRCLRKNRTERYEETRELLQELRAVSMRNVVPPLPPVPQNPEPDVPSIARSISGEVEGELREAFGQVKREIHEALGQGTLLLRSGEGRVRTMSESRLRRRLRRSRFTGDEMVRREGDDEWVHLYESEIFRQEVPFEGDPSDWIRKRKLKEFCEHACVFVTFGIAWFLFRGEIPFWMGFWGVGLAAHGVNALPAALPLLRRRKELARPESPALPVEPEALPEWPLSPTFRDEVARVKDLLMRRGGDEADRLIEEVDGIVSCMNDLATKRQDLAEQTSTEERARLRETLEEAEQKLVGADTANDRRLYQRQLDVLRQRSEAIEKALGVINRLEIRQDVAENQIKQLRLDLSRVEASSASVPELTSRLQDIRLEVEATERVDEAIARELLS